MYKLSYSFFLPILFFIVSCGGNDYDELDYMDDYISTVGVEVDNGADTSVLVTITGIDRDTVFELEIGSFELERVYLPYGKYTVDAVTSLDSVILDKEEIYLDEEKYHYSYNLNLTREDYIVENIRYSVGTDMSYLTDEFSYKGETYEGVSAKVITGKLLVPNSWDYNIDEEAPEEVEVASGQSHVTKTKLYRANTFLLYLMLYDLFGDYEGDEYETDPY